VVERDSRDKRKKRARLDDRSDMNKEKEESPVWLV
jgi:hypothetical protein